MRVGVVVLWLLAVGCKAHVNLVPPPPNAPAEERIRAFERMHAVSETVRTCQGSGCGRQATYHLTLGSGEEVYHVEDLLPAVSPTSQTAREIDAVHRKQRRGKYIGLVGLTAMVGGFALFVATESSTVGIVALGVTLPFALGAYWYERAANGHIERAHDAYNEDLADRLNVCVTGLGLTPCEAIPMPELPRASLSGESELHSER